MAPGALHSTSRRSTSGESCVQMDSDAWLASIAALPASPSLPSMHVPVYACQRGARKRSHLHSETRFLDVYL